MAASGRSNGFTGIGVTRLVGIGLVLGALLAASVRGAEPAGSQRRVFAQPPVSASGLAEFSHTGLLQSFTVPAGVTQVTVLAVGARGGHGGQGGSPNCALGGRGASIQGSFAVTPGQPLAVLVGAGRGRRGRRRNS